MPTKKTSAEKRALARRDDYRRAQSLMSLWISQGDLHLDMVAGELGMTPRQLQRVFHSQRSEGFRAELLEMRMSLARRLLDSDRPISEIAAAVGYRGPMHFAKAFRRRWGCSPRQYRKRLLATKRPEQSSGSAVSDQVFA